MIETEPVIAKVSEINTKAEEIKTKRALPPKPGDRVSFKELQQWLALLSVDAEERVTIWVYRLEPIINRQIVDPQANNNIDILYNGFNGLTEEYMLSRHGGGTYKFVIKDEDKPKTQLGGFFEAKLVLNMVEAPPKLDLREVEWDNPKNKGYQRWARTQRLINENNMPVIEKQVTDQPTSTGVDAAMLKMMLDFTAKMSDKEQVAYKQKIGGEDAANKSMNELFLEKLKQEDPNKQMTVVVSLITAMKAMQPEVRPDNTLATIMPMFMTMMAQMNEAANRQMTMVVEMMKANKSEPREEVDELDKLHKLLAIAKEIKGGGSAPEKTVTESLIEASTQILPGVLSIIGNITSMNAARATSPNITGNTNGNTHSNFTPHNNPTPMQTLHEQNTMNQPNLTNPKPTPGLPVPSEAANLILQFEPIIINKLAQPGWEFAAWVADGFGDMSAASIAKYGTEALLTAAKSIPSFWSKIEASYGEAHLRKWLDSLCNYKAIIEQMDAEEEEMPEVKEKL